MQHETDDEPLPPLDPHGLHMIAEAMQSTRPETAKFLRLQAKAMEEHMANLAGIGGILSGMARPAAAGGRARGGGERNQGTWQKRKMEEAMLANRALMGGLMRRMVWCCLKFGLRVCCLSLLGKSYAKIPAKTPPRSQTQK